MSLEAIDYSVVIPILNEEDTLPELCRRLYTVIAAEGSVWEVIVVNDGSTDGTLQLLLQLREQYPELKIVNLARNFGHQPAVSAGIQYAGGRAVILMDGDLQDLPEAIPQLIEKWKVGYEVVYAIRTKRKEAPLKRMAFTAFYWLQTTLSSVKTPLNAGLFSLLDRKVVDVLRRMPEHNRYLPGLRAYVGFRQTGVEVERGGRQHGEPRVSVFHLIKLALDGMFAFSTMPLRLVFLYGFLLSIVALLIAAVGLYFRFVLERPFLSWTYGLTTVFFFGGVQLMSIGIIGEYIGRIYEEVKQRPYFIERDLIGFEETAQTEWDPAPMAGSHTRSSGPRQEGRLVHRVTAGADEVMTRAGAGRG